MKRVFGASGGIRTPDQVVRSHLLYPAELRMRNLKMFIKPSMVRESGPYFLYGRLQEQCSASFLLHPAELRIRI